MKIRFVLLLAVLISTLALSACGGSLLWFIPVSSETTYESTNEPIEVVETLPAEYELPIVETEETEPVLSFAAAEYRDEEAGIALYYPVEWSVLPREQVGERGSQAALLSAGSTLEQVAENGSRVTLVLYKWDPKNDLAAFIAQRELAWEASGFEFAREDGFLMEDGREVVLYTVVVGDGNEALFAFTTAGEDYLQIAGEGDLALCREIIASIQSLE
jgi:hypothetical protein